MKKLITIAVTLIALTNAANAGTRCTTDYYGNVNCNSTGTTGTWNSRTTTNGYGNDTTTVYGNGIYKTYNCRTDYYGTYTCN